MINFKNFNLKNTTEYTVSKYFLITNEIKRRLNDKIFQVKLLPYQKKFVKSTSKITMLLGGNRSGKTFSGVINVVLAALDLHPVIKLGENAVIWIVGLDRVNHLYPVLMPYVELFIPPYMIKRIDRKDSIMELTNDKVIYFKSCDSGVSKFQSAAVDLVWFDEEPPYDIWRETYMRTIDKASHIYITMTPTNGISWSYKEIFQKKDKDKDYNVITATTFQNSYLPKSEIERLEKELSEEEREMRLYGGYIDLGGRRVFDRKTFSYIIKTLKDPILQGDLVNYNFVTNENGMVKIYEKYKRDAYYVLGVDSSEGINDPTAMIVMEYLNGRISVAAVVNALVGTEYIHKIMLQLAALYNYPLLIIERNSTGASVIERIKYDYQGLIYVEERYNEYGEVVTKKLGWRTDRFTKSKLVIDLKTFLLEHKVNVHDKLIWKQIKDYTQDDKGRYKGLEGHDDLVVAFALCVQAMTSEQFSVNLRRSENTLLKNDLVLKQRQEINKWFDY